MYILYIFIYYRNVYISILFYINSLSLLLSLKKMHIIKLIG